MTNPFARKSTPEVLSFVFLCFCLLVTCYFIYRFEKGSFYIPYHVDETIFYNQARAFYETGSVKAVVCIEEQVSFIFGANWYGVFYSFLFGLPAMLFGFSQKYCIWMNLVFTISCLPILYYLGLKKGKEWLVMPVFLMFFVVAAMPYSWFPESFNILLGVLLTYMLFRIAEKGDGLVVYLLLCLLFSFIRPTWVFWTIGVLPFCKNRRELYSKVLICIGCVFIAFLYVRFFCAPFFLKSTSFFTLFFKLEFKSGFIALAENARSIGGNLYRIYSIENYSPWTVFKILFNTLHLYWIYKALKSKDKLLWAVTLICTVSMVVFVLMYSVRYPYYMKLSGSFYLLLFIFTIYRLNSKAAIIFYLCFMFSGYLYSIPSITKNIIAHQRLGNDTALGACPLIEKLKQIKSFMHENQDHLVLFCNYEMAPVQQTAFKCSLPLNDDRGNSIRYTLNMFDPAIPYDSNFRFHNRMQVDYILSRKPLTLKHVELLDSNEYFMFYRNLKPLN